MLDELLALQEKIYCINQASDYPDEIPWMSHFTFAKVGDLYDITFYGEAYDGPPYDSVDEGEYGDFAFASLLECLIKHSDKIVSLQFSGPDQGTNGIREWNFTRLVNADTEFSNLKRFGVKLTDTGHHNQSIIGYDDGSYKESGMIAKLVEKMPNLEELFVPSAPDISFFKLPELRLTRLVVQAGYDHQNFIQNLSEAKNLPMLFALDYTEQYDYFNELGEESFTPFCAYENLFNSEVMASSSYDFHFTLRENHLSRVQLFILQSIRDIQFLHIRTQAGQYVSHRMTEARVN